jgi:hypothetical protein
MSDLEGHLSTQWERSAEFFWHRARWDFVRGHLPARREATVLDLGAGAGLLGRQVQAEMPGWRYAFVEPIASLEADLEARHGAERNGAKAPELYEQADAVTLLDVLEHIEHDDAFLKETVGRLRSGTVLIITVPALPSLWSSWDEALGHHRRYRKAQLQALMEGLPVKVVETSYLFPELLPLGYLRRLLRALKIGSSEADENAFPNLPGPVNNLLYRLASLSLRLRRRWPAGTSLGCAAIVE